MTTSEDPGVGEERRGALELFPPLLLKKEREYHVIEKYYQLHSELLSSEDHFKFKPLKLLSITS